MNRQQRRAAAKRDDPQALYALGRVLERSGKPGEAQARYRQAVAIEPTLHQSHNNLANLLQAQGLLAEAAIHYRKALDFAPRESIYHNNLGNTVLELGHPADAIELLRQAIALRPDYSEAHYNLARGLLALGRTDEAIGHYQRALEIKPGNIEARIALGQALVDQGRVVEALDHAEIASRSSQDPSFPLHLYGVLLARCGCADGARICWTVCLERDPEDRTGARLLLAALGKAPIPDRASSAQLDEFYARRANYWDQVAASGEARGYRGADLVASTLGRVAGDAGQLDVVDAGCGTGLVGELIAKKARRLVGVDASWPMLEKAREKAIYGELHHGDLIEFLNDRPDNFDVVTSAATLIHFGDLRPAFEAAATTLRDRGLFVFTLFPNEDDENAIAAGALDGHAQGGCYRHGGNYVAGLAAATGFAVESQCLDVHEYSHGTPRMGLVTALRRMSREQASS